MRRTWSAILLIALAFLMFKSPSLAMAQESQPPVTTPELTIYTTYPSQVVGIGESASLNLTLHDTNTPGTVQVEMKQIPEGWTATFRGGGHIIQSVYVQPSQDATVELRLDQPSNVKPGTYNFVVLATGDNNLQSELPLELTITEKLPPRLSLTAELPTLKGSPSTSFRYSATLKNEGDEDLTVNLTDNAPSDFQVNFTLLGQDVNSVPLAANESKSLSIELKPVGTVAAGSYPFTVSAQGGDANASLKLDAEVTGQSQLSVTGKDGRLSGQANAGQETPITVVVQNTGSAPARGIVLSATNPSGWTVNFDPKQIDEIPAGNQVQVTANVTPAQQAVAGDYMVTVQAKPADGASQSADFRITVLTSTLWGVVGIGLIAVALAVVALAVLRFGRR